MKTIKILFCGIAVGVLVLLTSMIARSKPAGNEVTALNVSIREWDVPTRGANPHDPAVGPDGALWFTEQSANKVGRLDPATGTFKEYSLIEGKNSGPHGLVADKDGNIWYTAHFGGYIGKLDPRTGKVTEYKMPDESVDDPHTVVFDARGILWFTAQGGNAVGRLDPRTGKIELKKVQTESALPYGIQINSKGVPFFCELGTNKMGKIDPATMGITEYKLPEGARPRRLAIAADDKIYFTDFKGGNLGLLDPTTGAIKMCLLPAVTTQARTASRLRRMEWSGTAKREESPARSVRMIRRRARSRARPVLRAAAWFAKGRQRPSGGCIL